jgi:flagellar biogenesis protein FliO
MPIHSVCLLLLSAPQSQPGGPDLTRYVIVVSILLLAIGALAFGFKKLVAGAVKTRGAQRSLQVMDLLPLGGKQRVCVVRCYDRTFALGLGDKEVALIAELDPVLAPAPTPASRADTATFAGVLQRLRKKTAERDLIGAANKHNGVVA